MKKLLLILLVMAACSDAYDWTENTSIYGINGVSVWMEHVDEVVTIHVTGAILIGGEIVLDKFYVVDEIPYSFNAKSPDSFRVTLYLKDYEGNKHRINTIRRI